MTRITYDRSDWICFFYSFHNYDLKSRLISQFCVAVTIKVEDAESRFLSMLFVETERATLFLRMVMSLVSVIIAPLLCWFDDDAPVVIHWGNRVTFHKCFTYTHTIQDKAWSKNVRRMFEEHFWIFKQVDWFWLWFQFQLGHHDGVFYFWGEFELRGSCRLSGLDIFSFLFSVVGWLSIKNRMCLVLFEARCLFFIEHLFMEMTASEISNRVLQFFTCSSVQLMTRRTSPSDSNLCLKFDIINPEKSRPCVLTFLEWKKRSLVVSAKIAYESRSSCMRCHSNSQSFQYLGIIWSLICSQIPLRPRLFFEE